MSAPLTLDDVQERLRKRLERRQAAWALGAKAGVRVAKARRYLDGEPVSGLARRMCDTAARELGLLHLVRPPR